MLYSINLLKQRIPWTPEYHIIKDNLIAKLFEIEHGETQRKIPNLVVMGKVSTITKHPNADTLRVCQVDCGKHGSYQICTGWENISNHQFVPVALPGCFLPAIDLTIQERTMRWVTSNGMICSKSELGIHEDEDKHWIRDIGQDLPCDGDMVWKHIGYLFPWLENTIFEVESVAITNRSDLWGHFGLACECRAILSDYSESEDPIHQTILDANQFTIQSLEQLTSWSDLPKEQTIHVLTNSCVYYSIISIPEALNSLSVFPGRVALMDLGHDPKRNRIDFSNYFMSNYGQPIHVFDAGKVTGSISIKDASGGEIFVDLTGKEHTLVEWDIIICDDEKILALGGIIGGHNCAFSEQTLSISIEVAHFDQIQIRKTATRLGLKTDAAVRFEKSINPLRTAYCTQELYKIVTTNHTTNNTGAVTWVSYKSNGLDTTVPAIDISIKQATEYIHGSFDPHIAQQIIPILQKLGYKTTQPMEVGETWEMTHKVFAPIRRSDVHAIQDIYEDLARVVWLETIQELPLPLTVSKSTPSLIQFEYELAEKVISACWFDQIETYPWYGEKQIDMLGLDRSTHFELLNPTDSTTPFMIQTLLPGLLNIVEKNYRQITPINIFEIGKVYMQWDNKSIETKMFAAMNCLKKATTRDQDPFVQLKKLIQIIEHFFELGVVSYEYTHHQVFHPRKQASILCGWSTIGFIGELHPNLLSQSGIDHNYWVAYLALELEKLHTLKWTWKNIHYLSTQDQLITRDLSFELSETTLFDKVIWCFQEIELIYDFEIIDLFKQLESTKKSITVRFQILWDGTLTTEWINNIMDQIIVHVEQTGATLKGVKKQ